MEQFNLGPAAEEAEVNASADNVGMVFNLNEVEEQSSSFEVLPKGTYNAIVEEFEFTTYSIIDGEYADRKIFDYYVLTGEGAKYALPRLKQLITRVVPEEDSASFNPSKFAESGIIINRQCRITLGIQTQKKGEYKGEKRNNVKEVLAANSMETSFLG